MTNISSFSDKFLIHAATTYVYMMSDFMMYQDPIEVITQKINQEYSGDYQIEIVRNTRFERNNLDINLRYLLIKNLKENDYALIFQGSSGNLDTMFTGQDYDWANNLSSAAHLPLDNYSMALAEFNYLVNDLGYNISALAGNSLGGAYALAIASENDKLRAIGVNPAPPEIDKVYINNGYSTILLQSTDPLYRLLKIDTSRSVYNSENQLARIFGFEPYIVKRSLPYDSKMNIAAAHKGDIFDRLRIIEMLYQKNSLYYNSKILGSNKGLEFSKLLFAQVYRKLPPSEYYAYVEKNIYKNMFLSNRYYIDSFKSFPALAEFIAYDLLSGQLIDLEGKLADSTSKLKVNFEAASRDYLKSQSFLLDNSLSAIIDTYMNDAFTYKRPKFFAAKFDLGFEWDWVVFKMFLDSPLTFKIKVKELVDKVLKELQVSNKKIELESNSALVFDEKFQDEYIHSLYSYIKSLKNIFVIIENNLSLTSRAIDSGDLTLLNEFNASTFDLEIPIILKSKLLSKYLEKAERIIFDDQAKIDNIINVFSKLLLDILEASRLEYLNKLKKEKSKANQILLDQFTGLIENFDYQDLFRNLIIEFKEEFVHLLLEENNSIQVYYNLVQMHERNQEFKKTLSNLNLYCGSENCQNLVTILKEQVAEIDSLLLLIL